MNILKLILINFKLTLIQKNIRPLCRGIIGFKKGCQLRTNAVKDEKDDLLSDSNHILLRWRNHFSQLLNYFGLMMIARQKYMQKSH